jgi:type II secretion system protein H
MRRVARRTSGPARAEGFSLLELVVVLVLIATVAAVVAPRFSGSYRQLLTDTGARHLRAFLQSVRLEASASGVPHVVRLEQGWSRFAMHREASIMASLGPGDTRVVPVVAPGATFEVPERLRVVAVYLQGRPVTLRSGLDLRMEPLHNEFDLEIHLAGASGTRIIRMHGASGRVTIQ